jgi:RNA polymerase sigma factor (TIGR02999 family)
MSGSGPLSDDVTRLVNLAAQGDDQAAAQVWEGMYEDLRATARRVLGPTPLNSVGQPGPTTLVHEVFLKVFRNPETPPAFENRRHFFGSMARAMGQFLVDYRRTHRREKRGGLVRTIPLGVDIDRLEQLDEALIATDNGVLEAIRTLEVRHPLAADVVWLRFIAGLTLDQTAQALGVAPRTVSKHWNYARAFVRRELERMHGPLTDAAEPGDEAE